MLTDTLSPTYSNITMKLQYQGMSSSLYVSFCGSWTWRHMPNILTNNGCKMLLKSLCCKDRTEYTVWNLINTNIQIQSMWMSAKIARPRVCTRSPDWILVISESWKVSGSLSQHHYCASSCRGRRRKSSVSDCGRGPQHSLHMYQVKHIRQAGRRAAEEAAAGGSINGLQRGYVNWSDWSLNI